MKRQYGERETANCWRCADKVLRRTLVKDGYTGHMVCPRCYDRPVKKDRTTRRKSVSAWEE